MVVTDEEQGYAPAVVLEAVDMTYEDVPELASNEGQYDNSDRIYDIASCYTYMHGVLGKLY